MVVVEMVSTEKESESNDLEVNKTPCNTRELLKKVRESAEIKFANVQSSIVSRVEQKSKLVLKGSESPAWNGSITKIKLLKRPKPQKPAVVAPVGISVSKQTTQRQSTQPATRSLYDYFSKVRREYEDFREIEAVRLQKRLEKFSDFPKGTKSVNFEEFEKEIVPWQNDSSTRNCFICLKDFNFINRRHHCRLCGRIICSSSDCTANIPIKLEDSSLKDLKSCTKCYKFLFKKPKTNVRDNQDQMNLIFKKIKSVKEQLLETIPRFNEYLMEESITEARPLKEWRQDAWTLRDTLILYSVHFRSSVQELCELIERESLENPIYKVLAGNLRRSCNEFLQKYMFTLQILEPNHPEITHISTIVEDKRSSYTAKFKKIVSELFTDDQATDNLEFYTDEGDKIKDVKLIEKSLDNQESILNEQLNQLEKELLVSEDDEQFLLKAIEDVKIELDKLKKIQKK